MEYKVEYINEKTIIGKSMQTSNVNLRSLRDKLILSDEYNSKRIYDSIKNKSSENLTVMYFDQHGKEAEKFSMMYGCEVSDHHNEELEIKVIPAGKYAKFKVMGNVYCDVAKAWLEICSMNLNRKYDYDFETYRYDSNMANLSNATVYLYVSIN